MCPSVVRRIGCTHAVWPRMIMLHACCCHAFAQCHYLLQLDSALCVQVYVTKKPGNFVQHFLEICHSNRPRSGVDLHQYLMERPPHQFFSQKNVGVARSKILPRKRVFFSLRAATPPSRISAAATAALSENFGRGATFERDSSLDFKSSEKTEGTLPEELDRDASTPLVGA